MRYNLFFVIILATINVLAQSPNNNGLNETTFEKCIIRYDTKILHIPGKTLPIGILTVLKNGDTIQTKGFLKGKDKWTKYKLEVEGGDYFFGKIKIKGTNTYKKYDSVIVKVYTRKWFLGRKVKWLFTQKIPYNYETEIHFLTNSNLIKAPGNYIQFGIRTYFDNKMFVDTWSSSSENIFKDFVLIPDGGYISESKGDLKIYNDPFKIINNKVKLIAVLAKNRAISDTLQIMLNYIDHYECKIYSNSRGHDLNVKADVYFDSVINEKLMEIKVTDNHDNKLYNYLINVNGGSITVSSYGARGTDGSDGLNGLDGTDGLSGSYYTESHTETDPEGNLITIDVTVQGSGEDGSAGSMGEDGSRGGNGYDGGNISISYTKSAEPYLNMIEALSISGSGGRGGSGGKGGRGGSGGNGNPSGNSGSDGLDGFAGFTGSSGNKGKIIFIPI